MFGFILIASNMEEKTRFVCAQWADKKLATTDKKE
jgi:hypothetical protein